MILDDFDFLMFKNRLVEISPNLRSTRGEIKKEIDRECVRQGLYSVCFTVERHQHTKENNGIATWQWLKSNPKHKLIESIFEVLEEADIIEFDRVELKADRWKVYHYKIIEDRNELEIIKDMIPEASSAEVMMVFKLLKTSNVSKAVRIFKEFKELANVPA